MAIQAFSTMQNPTGIEDLIFRAVSEAEVAFMPSIGDVVKFLNTEYKITKRTFNYGTRFNSSEIVCGSILFIIKEIVDTKGSSMSFMDTPPALKTCKYCHYDKLDVLPFRCNSLKTSETPKPWVSCGCFKEKK